MPCIFRVLYRYKFASGATPATIFGNQRQKQGCPTLQAHPKETRFEGCKMSRISSRKISRSFLCGAFLALACASLANAQELQRRIINKVEAQYPAILKRRGIGGTVRMKVTV